MTNRFRMTVLATNAEDAPGFYLTFVEATDLQYNEGRHYEWPLAPAEEEEEGYRSPMTALTRTTRQQACSATEFMEDETDEV